MSIFPEGHSWDTDNPASFHQFLVPNALFACLPNHQQHMEPKYCKNDNDSSGREELASAGSFNKEAMRFSKPSSSEDSEPPDINSEAECITSTTSTMHPNAQYFELDGHIRNYPSEISRLLNQHCASTEVNPRRLVTESSDVYNDSAVAKLKGREENLPYSLAERLFPIPINLVDQTVEIPAFQDHSAHIASQLQLLHDNYNSVIDHSTEINTNILWDLFCLQTHRTIMDGNQLQEGFMEIFNYAAQVFPSFTMQPCGSDNTSSQVTELILRPEPLSPGTVPQFLSEDVIHFERKNNRLMNLAGITRLRTNKTSESSRKRRIAPQAPRKRRKIVKTVSTGDSAPLTVSVDTSPTTRPRSKLSISDKNPEDPKVRQSVNCKENNIAATTLLRKLDFVTREVQASRSVQMSPTTPELTDLLPLTNPETRPKKASKSRRMAKNGKLKETKERTPSSDEDDEEVG